jgi:hypothetical protein
MIHSARVLLATSMAAGAIAASACAKPPPPPKPPVAEAAPAPEPPPKACEALSEGCIAKADTRVGIGTTWSIAPPTQWTYAKERDATIARTDGAVLAATTYDGRPPVVEKPKKTASTTPATKARDEALEGITKKIAVTLLKKMTWPAKPARVVAVGDREVALHQIDGATQDGKRGALLVFTSKPSEETLLGVGFVLESDTKDADRAILTGLESLRAESGKREEPAK